MKNGCNGFIERYIGMGGEAAYREYLLHLEGEYDALGIPGLPAVRGLESRHGSTLPAEYVGPGGRPLPLLEKDLTYWAARIIGGFDGETQYLLVAGTDFLLVAMEREEGLPPELLLWKRR